MTHSFTKGVPIDTDGTLSLNSNQVVPSQAAVVTYVTNSTANKITGNSGGALFPSAGNWNILGGTGITTSGASNTLTISATSSGMTWSETSGTVNASINNGYFITGTCTSTLPLSPVAGDVISYIVDAAVLLTIQANTGQFIRLGTTLSAAAGTCISTQRGDSITLVYRSSTLTWLALSANGGWNIT